MSHLIYGVLIQEATFPLNSREHAAVEGCPPNSGYHALYNLLRLHHPLLHSVLSTANEIPRHRRTEAFSQYLRRLQEFFARERLATRTYSESEALDLAVRNLTAEWRNEFRRMIERDKRAGPYGTLPFKLALPQLATTFVEYAAEVGREPPGPGSSAHTSRSAPTSIMRRLETTPDEHEEFGFLDGRRSGTLSFEPSLKTKRLLPFVSAVNSPDTLSLTVIASSITSSPNHWLNVIRPCAPKLRILTTIFAVASTRLMLDRV